jgi:hypothetical protein
MFKNSSSVSQKITGPEDTPAVGFLEIGEMEDFYKK